MILLPDASTIMRVAVFIFSSPVVLVEGKSGSSALAAQFYAFLRCDVPFVGHIYRIIWLPSSLFLPLLCLWFCGESLATFAQAEFAIVWAPQRCRLGFDPSFNLRCNGHSSFPCRYGESFSSGQIVNCLLFVANCLMYSGMFMVEKQGAI